MDLIFDEDSTLILVSERLIDCIKPFPQAGATGRERLSKHPGDATALGSLVLFARQTPLETNPLLCASLTRYSPFDGCF